MTQPWLRKVELIIGSLPDWQQDPTFSGPPAPVALRVYSDGTQNNLRIRFNVYKHAVAKMNPTTIQIYNLSAELRNSLLAASGSKEMRGAQVILKVGWGEGNFSTLFTGGLWAAWSRREGADIVTSLACLSELPAYRGNIQKTVAANYSLATLIKEVATEIPGITVTQELIMIDSVRTIGRRGMTLSGSPADCLTLLARTYGFSWHILDGVFEAAMDMNGDTEQAFMGSVIPVNNRNGFLLRAEPILVSPFQQQSGVAIHTLLNPLINPFRVVDLESDLNPRLNGSYMAQTVTHTGDTFGNSWFTDIETILITPTVQTTGVRSVDAAGVAFIAKEEGNVLTEYLVAGIPHIGVGHRLTALELKTKIINIKGVPVNYSSGITNQQSLDLAAQDLARFESAINKGITKPLNQKQYNALASIAYNGGEGVATGSLAQTINSGDYAKAGQDILSYKITAEGVPGVYPPLVARRKREAALWNGNA